MRKDRKVGKKYEWERYLSYEIEDLDNFFIPYNNVLIEFNEDEYNKTIGGILTVRDQDFAAHAVRRGIVRKLPEKLCSVIGDPNSMPWKCDIDIQVGDEIFLIHQDYYNSYPFEYKGSTLKLIKYDGILLARRGKEIIMCNGYILMEKVFKTINFGEFSKKQEDKTVGIIRAIGKPNKVRKTWSSSLKREVFEEDSQIELNVGDRVKITDTTRVFELEDYSHAVFEDRKIFNVCNRRRIGAIF